MHILGKILTWMLVISAGAATVLMSRQLDIKNKYTEQLKKAKEQYANNAKQIQEAEAKLAKLDHDYEKVMHGQNIYWDRRTAARNPNDGSLGVGVGLQDGIGRQIDNAQPPAKLKRRTRLYVFRQAAPNNPASIYVGPFSLSSNAADLGPRTAKLLPDWNVRAGESNAWQGPGNVWRIRATIPEKYTTLFDTLYLQLESLDRDLADARKKDAAADADLKHTDNLIATLRTQIAGTDGSGGLVKQLNDSEEARNKVLGEVDGLRRDVKKAVDQRTALVKDNQRLANQKPQP